MSPRDHLFRKMLVLSVGLHALAFVVSAVWMAYSRPSRILSPVTVVDLIGVGQIAGPPEGAQGREETRTPAPEPAKEAAPRSAKRTGISAKAPRRAGLRGPSPPDTRAFSEKIIRMRKEQAEKERFAEALEGMRREQEARKAVGGIKERVGRRVDLSAMRGTAAKRTGTPGPAGMPGAAGTARAAPELLAYARALDERIRSNWTVPELAQKDARSLIVQVRITIEKDGRVGNVVMEKSSGNTYFDDSVRRAIQKSSPLPTPPEQLREGQDYYDVGFRFFGGGGDT
jgi:colicin import membrane protein